MNCPTCASEVPRGARFCPNCGSSLSTRSDERRVVSVLFGDLVGFTALSETLDPEQVKNLVDRAMERLATDVVNFGGQVDKVIGDAIVALFGAPVAHEDDAERAVRAALHMQQTLRVLELELGIAVKMRIGVNTGEALVGAILSDRDYTAVGDAVNVAARLQAAAAPGTVLVGRATYDATVGVIRYEAAPPIDAKGKDQPIEAFVAFEPVGLPGERPARPGTPMIGRDGELFVLRRGIAASVRRSRASLMLVMGDAGMGKTRLVREAVQSVQAEHDLLVLRGRCVPYGEANPWWPVAEALRGALDLPPETPFDVAEQVVSRAVADAYRLDSDSLAVQRAALGLLHLLDYDTRLKGLEAQDASAEAGRAVRTFLQARAAQTPIVLWLTDLHWADDVVLRMLDGLLGRLSRLPFVIIATARHALSDRWAPKLGRFNTITISLDPLDTASSEALVHALLGADIPASLLNELVARSGGNPFYLEELAVLVRDQQPGAYFPDLPSSVRALVAARVDGLPEVERRVLEDASVLGRRGQVLILRQMAEVLHQITAITDPLMSLADKDLLLVPRPDKGDWSFRSELVREVIYERLTKAERARRHYTIAETLAGQADAERNLDMIAFHYRRSAELSAEISTVDTVPADAAAKAAQWLVRAGRASLAAASPTSAVRSLSFALRYVSDPDERAELLSLRAQGQVDLREFDQARRDLAEATEIARDQRDLIEARAQLRLGDIERHLGHFDQSVALLRDASTRFGKLGLVSAQAEALRLEGMTHLLSGRTAEAEACAGAALAAFQKAGSRTGEAWARQNLAWNSFVRGDVREAEARVAEASALFEEIGDQGGLAWSDGLLGFVRMHDGHFDEADMLAQRALRDARERGDRWAEGMMLMLRSAVALWSGAIERAVRRGNEALAVMRSIGDIVGQLQASAFLGRALVASGHIDEGFAVFAAAADEQASHQLGGAVQLVNIAAASSACSIGDVPESYRWLADIDDEALDPRLVGHADCLVEFARAALQSQDLARAGSILTRVSEATAARGGHPAALAAHALVKAASHQTDEALRLARAVGDASRSTYIDRVFAKIAEALVEASAADSTALEHALADAQAVLIEGEDMVLVALVALARAEIERHRNSASAAEAMAEAERQLDALHADYKGWRAVFSTALGPACGPTEAA